MARGSSERLPRFRFVRRCSRASMPRRRTSCCGARCRRVGIPSWWPCDPRVARPRARDRGSRGANRVGHRCEACRRARQGILVRNIPSVCLASGRRELTGSSLLANSMESVEQKKSQTIGDWNVCLQWAYRLTSFQPAQYIANTTSNT